MDFCIYGGTLAMIQITDRKLLHFKLSKSGQVLRVDKTCFPRPGHNYIMIKAHLCDMRGLCICMCPCQQIPLYTIVTCLQKNNSHPIKLSTYKLV